MFGTRLLLATATVALLALSGPVDAKTFRFANDGDVNSMDPHARNETFLLSFTHNIYEPLVRRDKQLKLEGALAQKWSNPSPTVWRFELRPNVKWHDGSPFTADDVVFTLIRANSDGSNMRGHFASFKEVRKINDLTVEIETKYPDPVYADKLAQIAIMSKAWSEKNNATRSADLTKKRGELRDAQRDGHRPVHAQEPRGGREDRAREEPELVGQARAQRRRGRVLGHRQRRHARRGADLRPGRHALYGAAAGREPDRPDAGAQGRRRIPSCASSSSASTNGATSCWNPTSRARTRSRTSGCARAFYQAIDVEAIKSRVMRGQSTPVALMVAPRRERLRAELNVRPNTTRMPPRSC